MSGGKCRKNLSENRSSDSKLPIVYPEELIKGFVDEIGDKVSLFKKKTRKRKPRHKQKSVNLKCADHVAANEFLASAQGNLLEKGMVHGNPEVWKDRLKTLMKSIRCTMRIYDPCSALKKCIYTYHILRFPEDKTNKLDLSIYFYMVFLFLQMTILYCSQKIRKLLILMLLQFCLISLKTYPQQSIKLPYIKSINDSFSFYFMLIAHLYLFGNYIIMEVMHRRHQYILESRMYKYRSRVYVYGAYFVLFVVALLQNLELE